jgi:hypothetical protein
MTGTSINPLLRAAILTRDRADDMITLVLPFLPTEVDQKVRSKLQQCLTNACMHALFNSNCSQCTSIWLCRCRLLTLVDDYVYY